MTHIMIEDSSPEAKKLLAYVRTLPYVTVIDAKKRDSPKRLRLVMPFR